MPLAKLVRHIQNHMKELKKTYDKNNNKQKTKIPYLFNKISCSNLK